jgi:hypothetical protein
MITQDDAPLSHKLPCPDCGEENGPGRGFWEETEVSGLVVFSACWCGCGRREVISGGEVEVIKLTGVV